jgi:peroxiredoxin Q/BCP
MKKNLTSNETPGGDAQLTVGQPAPDFKLRTGEGNFVSLADYRGKKVVLFFYPEDDTPTCTKEACAFRDDIGGFQKRGAVVFGVSADSVDSHVKFKRKYRLNFPLLSDVDKQAINAYGVWQEKMLFGRKYMGIVRTTFIIDEQGKIAKIFPKVRVDGHVDDVLAAL